MKFSSLLVTAFSIYYQLVLIKAQSYDLYVSAPSGAIVTGFSGNMMIPPLESAGNYYLWTGLESLDQNGALQSSINGSSGSWLLGTGWIWQGNQVSWTNAVNTPIIPGRWLNFNFTYISDESIWVVTWNSLIIDVNFPFISTFLIESPTLSSAFFSVELDNLPWNFGPLEFTNISIVALDTEETSWCTGPPNITGLTSWTYANASASSFTGGIACDISQILLEN